MNIFQMFFFPFLTQRMEDFFFHSPMSICRCSLRQDPHDIRHQSKKIVFFSDNKKCRVAAVFYKTNHGSLQILQGCHFALQKNDVSQQINAIMQFFTKMIYSFNKCRGAILFYKNDIFLFTNARLPPCITKARYVLKHTGLPLYFQVAKFLCHL